MSETVKVTAQFTQGGVEGSINLIFEYNPETETANTTIESDDIDLKTLHMSERPIMYHLAMGFLEYLVGNE